MRISDWSSDVCSSDLKFWSQVIVLSIQMHRYGMITWCSISNTGHLKIRIGKQAGCDSFVEIQPHIIFDPQYPVSRLRAAKEAGTVGIFSAADYIRLGGGYDLSFSHAHGQGLDFVLLIAQGRVAHPPF